MKNKIKISTLIAIFAIITFGVVVYAATSSKTIIYYEADGTTEIARQEVTAFEAFTILDDDAATKERWIAPESGVTFATGQIIERWGFGLFPLKLYPYSESLYLGGAGSGSGDTDDDSGESGGSGGTGGPYLPTGFTFTSGYTIKDGSGNEYVWVEVPQTTEVYPTAGLGITSFTYAEYTKIENDLHTYTSVYRNGTSFTDTWYSEDQHGLTSTQYTELKQKMLKSIYKNGGFYVGKYETGTETARTSSSDALTTPVIQQNAYPYNYVTNKQAQTLASGMASGDYTSSLMFGVQWDLVLKYLETKGATQAELKEDSTSWGNYNNNLWNITNASSKYSTTYGSSWTSGAYGEKTTETSILLSTGASDTFSKQGIYDFAGNVFEWTLEFAYSWAPCAERGGDYYNNGSSYPASNRNNAFTSGAGSRIGFRVSLY